MFILAPILIGVCSEVHAVISPLASNLIKLETSEYNGSQKLHIITGKIFYEAMVHSLNPRMIT